MSPQDLTLVIPTHNRRSALLHAVESVLTQQPAVAEVIVVCDHCDDGSSEALRALHHPTLRVIERQTGRPGASAARNAGVAAATTPWVMFLDDDDGLHPGAVQAVIGVLEQTPDADWFWGERCWVAEAGEPIKVERFDDCRIDPTQSSEPEHCSAAQAATSAGFGIRRSVLLDMGGFDESLHVSEDRDLVYRLLRRGHAGQRVGHCLVDHHVHRGKRLSDPDDTALLNACEQRVIDKNREYLSQHPDVLAMHLHRVASKQRHGGDMAAARNTVRQILEVKPLDWKAWRRRLTW